MDGHSAVHTDTGSEPQVVLQTQNTRTRRDKYKRVLFALGIVETILGSIIFVLVLIPLAFGALVIKYQVGFAILVTISGVAGILTKYRPSVAMFEVNMVLSILSGVTISAGMIGSTVTAIILNHLEHVTVVTLCATLALSCIAAIVCFVHFAYCCAGVCSCCGTSEGVILGSQDMPQLSVGRQNMIQIPQSVATQYMYPANLPTTTPATHMEGNCVVPRDTSINKMEKCYLLPPSHQS